MENDILDLHDKTAQNKYTEKSFKFFIFSITCFVLSLLISLAMAITVNFKLYISYFIGFLVLIVFITGFIGFYYSILSLIKNEPNKLKKIIAFVGNTFLMLLNCFIIIFNLRDLFKYILN